MILFLLGARARLPLLLGVTSAVLLFVEIVSLRLARIGFNGDFLFFIIPLALLGVGMGSAYVFLTRVKKIPTVQLVVPSLLLPGATFAHVLVGTFAHSADFYISAPFFFLTGFIVFFSAGWIITEVLTSKGRSFGYVYAIDLCGAAIGVLAALFALNTFALDTVLVVACFFSLIPLLLVGAVHRGSVRVAVAVLFVSITSIYGMGAIVPTCSSTEKAALTLSNAYAYLRAVALHGDISPRFHVQIDCGGGSLVVEDTPEGRYELTHDVNSVAFAFVQSLNKESRVMVHGAGGGSDLLRAHYAGIPHIDTTELNPDMVEAAHLLSKPLPSPYELPGVEVRIGDSRRIMETTSTLYDLIFIANSTHYGEQPTMMGTISYAQTQEALITYMHRLTPGGVLAVVKYDHPLKNTPVLQALVRGGHDPAQTLLFVEGNPQSMVLVKPDGFTDADVERVRMLLQARGLSDPVQYEPGVWWANPNNLHTDVRPYPQVRESKFYTPTYLTRILTMLVGISCVGLIIFLFMAKYVLKDTRDVYKVRFATVAAASIGFGFVFLQLALFHKMLFLLDTAYAAALLIGAFLVGPALGAVLAQKYLSRRATVLITASLFFFSYMLWMQYYDMYLLHQALFFGSGVRAMVAVFLMLPPAIALGVYLPTLISIVQTDARLVAWVWFVDGLYGVLGGFAAKVLFHAWGLSSAYIIAIGVYAVVAALLTFLTLSSHKESA